MLQSMIIITLCPGDQGTLACKQETPDILTKYILYCFMNLSHDTATMNICILQF